MNANERTWVTLEEFMIGITCSLTLAQRPLLLVGRAAIHTTLAVAIALLAVSSPIGPAVPVARATGGVDGVFTHTTSTDFSVCTDLTGTIPAPVITSLTLSSAAGGELRLTPTLEDYFDGSTVDTGLWVSGTAQTFYTSTVEVADGVAILDGTYLRSQENFQATQPRFFEARARHLISGTNAGWPDLGFYRELPPFAYTGTLPADSALRIFVTRNDNSTFLRGRDGGSGAPLYDVEVDPDPDPSLYHTYRIEWDAGSAAETRFFIDGEAVGVITGSSDLHTWVFLYHQEATYLYPNFSPTHVDWVRAGQYATSSGFYTSCAEDAGGIVNWTTLNPTADLPTGASLAYQTRTSVNGVAWSSWQSLSGNTIVSPSGRYFQYRAAFTTTNALVTPELRAVQVSYYGPDAIQFTPASPTTLNPGATQAFVGQPVDGNGRVVTGLTPTWGLVNGGGVLGPTGVFTAGLPAGTFTNTIGMTVTTTAAPVTGRVTVAINDLAPTANISGATTVAEGSQIALTGSGSDPNGLPVTFSWDLNNDGSFETAGASANFSGLDDGTYTVRLRSLETGGGGLSTVVTRTVTVTNVAPVVAITGAPGGSITEGTAVTLGQTTTDAGAVDTHTYTWSVTKNGSAFASGSGTGFSFTPDDNGSYIVTVVATDDDGGQDTDSRTISVVNQAPLIDLGADLILDQGQPLSYVGSFTDPGLVDTFVGAVDYGAGSEALSLTPERTFVLSRPYQAVETLAIDVTITDDDGGVGTERLNVTWVNITPTIESVANTGPTLPGNPVTVTVTAADPGGVTDPLMYQFDCDNDGHFEVGPQTGSQTTCLIDTAELAIVRVRVSDSFGATVETTTIVNAPDRIYLPLLARHT